MSAIGDPLYDPSLPKMNDHLHKFTEEKLDAVADTVIAIVAFIYKYVRDNKNRPVRVKWHQLLWLALLEMFPWLLILAPRGHGKSTIFTSWMLYRVCHDPDYRFLIASHIEELADEFSYRVQVYLTPWDEEPPLDEPYIPRDFPDIKKGKMWRVGKAYFDGKRYPYVKTVAAKAGMTGGRFDGAVFDDPQTKMSVQKEHMRRLFSMWANNAVLPALDETDEQKFIGIGTRKHLEDWYSTVLVNPYFHCHVDQLYSYDSVGEKVYLWPAQEGEDHGFNEEREDKKRATMEPDEFAMEYMNIPFAGEGLRFKRALIEEAFYKLLEVPERHRAYYMGVDPCMEARTERSSHFALAVICFDKRYDKQDIYVVDMVKVRANHLSLEDQADIIRTKHAEWDPVMTHIEAVLVNRSFSLAMVRELPRMNPVNYSEKGLTGTSDISKLGRIENVFGRLIKKGKIHFKDPLYDPATKAFIEAEYVQFPEGQMDLLDALTLSVNSVDTGGRAREFRIAKY